MYKIYIQIKDKKILLEEVNKHYVDVHDNIMVITQTNGRIVFVPTGIIKQLNIITNYED